MENKRFAICKRLREINVSNISDSLEIELAKLAMQARLSLGRDCNGLTFYNKKIAIFLRYDSDLVILDRLTGKEFSLCNDDFFLFIESKEQDLIIDFLDDLVNLFLTKQSSSVF